MAIVNKEAQWVRAQAIDGRWVQCMEDWDSDQYRIHVQYSDGRENVRISEKSMRSKEAATLLLRSWQRELKEAEVQRHIRDILNEAGVAAKSAWHYKARQLRRMWPNPKRRLLA